MADRRLQVFHTVARLLSFTKAADTLHMTQPAVTFQVRQLEEYFNTRLFDRTHNRISLTEAGKRVYEYAGQIFQLYDEMESAVRELTGDISGVLMIGASTTIAEYMLPALLGDFKAEYPDVNIRLKVGNTDAIVSMVEDNEIDLGVVEAPVTNKNLAVELCRVDQLVVVMPPGHALAQADRVTIKDLLEHPYIVREEGSGPGRSSTSIVRLPASHPAACTRSWSWGARRPSRARSRRVWAYPCCRAPLSQRSCPWGC